MYAIISHHNELYEPLAKFTWYENKISYAERHGYHCEMEKIPEGSNMPSIQRQKVAFINKMLNDPRNFEWVWWTGCDLIVTNFNVKIEDKIDNNYHMVVAVDCNGINADSILIQNNEAGRTYWKMVEEILPTLNGHWEGEQKVMKDSLPNNQEHIKLVPQRHMNSYDYTIWNGLYHYMDQLGTNGQWQHGDWVIHWPANSLQNRILFAQHFSKFIVK